MHVATPPCSAPDVPNPPGTIQCGAGQPVARTMNRPRWVVARDQVLFWQVEVPRAACSVCRGGSIAAGASGPQDLHRITPHSLGTASASFQNSRGSVVASPHSWNRIARIHCPWPLSLRCRAPGPRASVTACAWPKPTRPVRSERAAQPVPSFRNHLGSQRSGAHPVPGPVNEQRPAVKIGRRVEPGIPARWHHRCMGSPSGNREASRTPTVDSGLRSASWTSALLGRVARQTVASPALGSLPGRRRTLVDGFGPALHTGGPRDPSPASPRTRNCCSSFPAALLNGPADASRDDGRGTLPVRRPPCRPPQTGRAPA